MQRGDCSKACWMGSLVLVIVLVWTIPCWAQRDNPALVEVAPVERKTIAQPVTFVGTVKPRRLSLVASEVEGIIAEMLVEEGQLVQQGEHLARLRQERLQIDLRNRHAVAERYHQELIELQNGTRPEVIEEARAAILEAEAELESTRREMERQKGLSMRGVAALRSRQDAETSVQVARQRLARARAQYEIAVRGPRAERLAQAEAQYQAAQAETARLLHDLRRSEVQAPYTGFVVAKHTEVGQWIGRGDPIVTLIELDKAHITIPVPERYISHVQLGAPALVQLDAFVGTTWQGKVIRTIPHAAEARTFPVTVEVDNPKTQIKSGFVARVTLTVGEMQDVLLVPKDAIVTQGPRHIVYVVREGKATPIPIQRTTFYQRFAVVTGPLQPGEQVVIRGNERLRPGQPVRLAQTN
jgi:multidrug efflux pump subunit AcrA (membrane-fusion protein)